MVHALEEIQRLLIPGGSLLDIQPAPVPTLFEVEQNGVITCSSAIPGETFQYVGYAEQALEAVIQRGLFLVERVQEFEWRTYAASVAELHDHIVEESAFEEGSNIEVEALEGGDLVAELEQALQSAGKGSQISRLNHVRCTQMKAVKG